MGVFLELVDTDEIFRQYSHSEETYIVNQISCVTQVERDAFNDKILTQYSPDDVLSNIPRCACHQIASWADKGVTCPNCNTKVIDRSGISIIPVMWIQAPQGVNGKKGVNSLINPMVWTMLRSFFNRSGFDTMLYLTDRSYRVDTRRPSPLMRDVMSLNIERGLNNFTSNFDEILQRLSELKSYRGVADRKRFAELMMLVHEQRSRVFPQYIPVPNRTLLVLERGPSVSFVEDTIPNLVDAIRTLAGIDTPYCTLDQIKRENRAIKTIDKLATAYSMWEKNVASSKTGLYRKQLYSGRSDHTFRAVISSISEPHYYRDIYIPWGIGITVFELYLINKLEKRGFTKNQSKEFLYTHAHRFNELLERLFEEIIQESPERGIACLLGRNPSLKRGSIQKLFITRVKRDVDERTIDLSTLVLRSLNADFDGRRKIAVVKLLKLLEALRANLATTWREIASVICLKTGRIG